MGKKLIHMAILSVLLSASIAAQAMPADLISQALNSAELKDKLNGVEIKKIQKLNSYKCPYCYQVQIEGEKMGVLGFLVEYQITFFTEFNFFDNKLSINIESESKN